MYLRLLCLWLLWPGLVLPAGAQTDLALSAQITRRDAGGVPRGDPARLSIAQGRVRIETPEVPTGYFLIDPAGTALFVRPERRIFMEARQSTRLTQLFVLVDPESPCGAWQAAARIAGIVDAHWRCERVASLEEGTVAYEVGVSCPTCKTPPCLETRWVSLQMRVPVKILTCDGGTLTLEQVQIAPQPDWFSVPAGFQRLDAQALFERLRHSDVWVKPPQ